MTKTRVAVEVEADLTGETEGLPEGWRWALLSEVLLEAQPGFASGARDPEGVVQVRMNNVTTKGTFLWDRLTRVPCDAATIERLKLADGDIVFNNTNSTELVGKTALFTSYEEPVVFSNHFTRIRVDRSKAEPGFIVFWFVDLWRRGVFAKLCDKWVGQSAIKTEKLRGITIPLPPLPEQKRLAAILTERLDAIERARVAAEEQLAAARALPAARLREVFGSAEAQKWPTSTLGEVLEQRQDIVHPRDHPKGATVFVGLEHIESGTGRRIGSVPVEMAELTGRKPRFYRGDIVYGYLRPYLNKVWIAEFDGLCSVDQYVFTPKSGADLEFLASFMRSAVYLSRAPIEETPGQLPRIRIEEVCGVTVNLPPLPKQREISAQIAKTMADADALRVQIEAELAMIERLPTTLLREAFAGKLTD